MSEFLWNILNRKITYIFIFSDNLFSIIFRIFFTDNSFNKNNMAIERSKKCLLYNLLYKQKYVKKPWRSNV